VDPEDFLEELVIGVDHDPEDTEDWECLSYDGHQGFPWCYDNHNGTDFVLEGGWEAMDEGVEVVAVADGQVVGAEDGHYDRCHLDWDFEATCDGFEMIPNAVYVGHGEGVVTGYLHLKKDSLMVEAGEEVVAGQVLALVGSSGNSTWPHLHFTVWLDGEVMDPYQGWWIVGK